MTLLAVLLLAAVGTAEPPCSDIPKTCAAARAMTADKFGGDQKAADRWAKKCGISRAMILQGKFFCGL
jgi:hypothetical protein